MNDLKDALNETGVKCPECGEYGVELIQPCGPYGGPGFEQCPNCGWRSDK